MNNELLQSPLFDKIKSYLTDAKDNEKIVLYVPYIKTKILEQLIEGVHNEMEIITNWKESNLLQGSSELELYPFCKKNNITLYSHDKIHLKVYSINLDSAIICSGNISERGLNPDKKFEGNYEIATIVNPLSIEDRLYLEKIKHEAVWINDEKYEQYLEWYNNHQKPEKIKIEKIKITPTKDNYSIDVLPWTENVLDLVEGYDRISKKMEPSDDKYASKCIIRDLSNYEIELGLTQEEFLKKIKFQFLNHPFMKKIIEILDERGGEVYYGELRRVLERKIITDVPPPDRQDVDICLRIIYDWFRDLGDGQYGWDTPKGQHHSQRLWKK